MTLARFLRTSTIPFAIALCTDPHAAGAVLLAPGGVSFGPPGAVLMDHPIIEYDSQIVDCSTFVANVQYWVIANPTGELDFYYQVRNDSGPNNIRLVIAEGFAVDPVVDVEFRTDGFGVDAPIAVSRAVNPGDPVYWWFGGIVPTSSSLRLYARTNNHTYDANGTVRVSDSVNTCGVFGTFRPT